MRDHLWKPGQSGNPKGRPKKGQTLTDILDKVLSENRVDYNGEKISGKEAAARKLFALAMAGDVNALKYVYDRIDGKPDVFQHVIEEDTPQIIIAGEEDGDSDE